MNIIIVGAGKVGLALTQQLSADNRVTVIDEDQQLIENIINMASNKDTDFFVTCENLYFIFISSLFIYFIKKPVGLLCKGLDFSPPDLRLQTYKNNYPLSVKTETLTPLY